MAKVIMVQGTMSGAGKSLLVAGLCRIFKQDGYKVAPFKSQNMALNSYITKDGLEMGRAQVMQAEAAGCEPSVLMNPILLKPTNNIGSQVIVNGEVLGNMKAKDYFKYKRELIPDIMKAYNELSNHNDIIVIEGAGSPAEINLRENDIVNMGLAELVDAPVLLVGDIDRGGVFAQLLGTLMLLSDDEKDRVEGLIINKFRGDKTILDPGIDMLEEKGNKKVVGVIPYMTVDIEDEDSLTDRFNNTKKDIVDIAVIHYPRISNFTDFAVFEKINGVSVRYVKSVMELDNPDMIILPGSKNTMGDLKWLRQNGLEAAIKKQSKDKPVIGICGGYQMLGMEISDPDMVEEGGVIRGLELLDIKTVLDTNKTRMQVDGKIMNISGFLEFLSDMEIYGYEIHMGKTEVLGDNENSFCKIKSKVFKEAKIGDKLEEKLDGAIKENIYGTYVHGIFDAGNIARSIVEKLAMKKGVVLSSEEEIDYASYKEKQYDILADTIRAHIDMEHIYKILRQK